MIELIALLSIASPNVLKVQVRTPMALVLATPTGEVAKTNNSEIIRMVTEVLERHTDFGVELVDATAIERCRGRLYCLADEARLDYSEERLRREDGGRMTYREHLYRLKEEGSPHARFMLLLTNVAIEGQPDRVTTVFVDTDRALALLHDTKREGRWQERIEALVSEQAVIASPPRREISDASEAAALIEELVTRDLRPVIEESGHWQPWGTISLEVDADEPFELALDEQTVGTTAPGTNELTQVSAGEHRIKLRHPRYADADIAVKVERGARVEVKPELVLTVHEPTVLRPITAWSGLVIALSGAVITTFAIVRQDKSVRTACFDEMACSHDGFATLSYAPGSSDPKNVNPSGVLMAPLGYSLIAAGATWSLGTVLFGGEGDVPWIQWIAGLVLGGAAYGISVAAGG